MKVTQHENYDENDTTPAFRSRPFRVWVDRKWMVELEVGDKLGEVARWLVAQKIKLKLSDARGLAACWFALGERGEQKKPQGNWTQAEMNRNDNRVYLAKK